MDRFQQLAGLIIDEVIDAVLEQNPEIDTSKKEGNALLYGEAYYDLESSVADKIRDLGSASARKKEPLMDANERECFSNLGSPSARETEGGKINALQSAAQIEELCPAHHAELQAARPVPGRTGVHIRKCHVHTTCQEHS